VTVRRYPPGAVWLVLAEQPHASPCGRHQLGPWEAVTGQVGHPTVPGLIRSHVAVLPVPRWEAGRQGACKAVPACSPLLLGHVHVVDGVCGCHAHSLLPDTLCALCARHHGFDGGSVVSMPRRCCLHAVGCKGSTKRRACIWCMHTCYLWSTAGVPFMFVCAHAGMPLFCNIKLSGLPVNNVASEECRIAVTEGSH
jgi:hypothetical protein